jgi:glutamate carboxypeptidase
MTDAVAWLAEQQDAMVALLRDLVNVDSGSYDKAGTDRVGDLIRSVLDGYGIPVETMPQQRHGDCLRAAVPSSGMGADAGRPVLLLGHRDTVFAAGEAARRPFRVEDGIAHGPGVADMKAGLVMNAFVLAAFARAGGSPAPLVGLFTGDEEIGSPEGRPVIEREARAARAVLNAEPGRPSGAVVAGRKGGVFCAIRIEGRAAHSGGNFEHGVSAVEELARKVQALHAITDLARGTTCNVGLVSGGQSVNTVAPWAEMQLDLRYVAPADRAAAMARVEEIVERASVPGTRAVLDVRGEFLPLVPTPESRRVFALYAEAARASGFEAPGEFVGGCADSGFAAAVGAPTLCATGPVGGRAHTPDEYLRLDTLVPRAQACARTILGLGAEF